MSPFRRRLLPLVLALLVGAGLLLPATNAAAAPAASGTHVLRIHFANLTVRVTVPSSWHVSHTRPTPNCGCGSQLQPVCVVARGDYDRNPYRCELVIGGGARYQAFDLPLPDWRLPSCRKWDTTYAADGRLGGRPAQYRIFLDRCHDRKAEQWLSATEPSVGLWHPLSWGADDRAAAEAARSVRYSPKVVTERYNDVGRVRGLRIIDGHAYVVIDRVVESLDGGLLDRTHATYRYRLHTPKRAARGTACERDWSVCNPKQLRQQFAKGPHPADGSRPLADRLVLVWRDDSFPRVFDLLRMRRTVRFESSGDPGSCGC